MMNEHEISYRSQKAFDKMKSIRIAVCGAGALGSNLVNNLVRQGFEKITVIDMDRVEQKNISTQVYGIKDVGQTKVNALKGIVYQTNKKVLNTFDKELNDSNFKKVLDDHALIVDVFDNWP